MGRKLVFIGAGHAHLTAISRLTNYLTHGSHVTVISPEGYQYYSGMGPGMFSGMFTPQEARFNMRKLTESRGGIFIEERVTFVDAEKRELTMSNGQKINYDVASFGIGSEIDVGPVDTSYNHVFKAKPVATLFKARCHIMKALIKADNPIRMVIIGGGATGVEVAGNAWRISQDLKAELSITLITNQNILNRFPAKVRKKALKGMKKHGIIIEENMPVKGNTDKKFLLEDGREIPYDFAIIATGTKPPDLFTQSNLPTGPDGGLLVNEYLQSVKYPELFGGGDCISFKPRPLDRVGVFAVRENPILLENLEAALLNQPLTAFDPQLVYLLILNMGDGSGIYNKKSLTFSSSIALKLKNYIDKKFMEEFQLSGELEDSTGLDETKPCDLL
jgi:NADH dehydrogenase FAD-containing subunit